jgi:hypothetical protein
VQGAGQWAAQWLVGAGFELAGSPAASNGGRAERIEEDGLADATQAGEDEGAFGAAAGDAFEDDVESLELAVAAGELGRTLTGAGGVGVADGIHGATVSGSIRVYRDI